MIDQAFKVATVFQFDIGSAIMSSKTLQGAVEGIDDSVNRTIGSFQSLGVSVLSSLGLGTSGLVGMLYSAIKASDKFAQTQLAFANTIAGQSVPFEERMNMAAGVMERINALASEFALPTQDLIDMTKVLGPMLNQKGLAGPNFSNAIDIGRNLLKSAPTLGVDPQLVQGQLLRMIEGHADGGDTLFNRMAGDTKTMKPYLGNAKGFNSMGAEERVKTLQKALKEFASDPLILAGNVKTLRGQMQLLNDAFTGAFSVLKDIGSAILGPLLNALTFANAWIRKEGKEIAHSFGRMIEPLIGNLERLIATGMQLQSLKADFQLTKQLTEFYAIATVVKGVLNYLGIRLAFTGGLTRILGMAFTGLGTALRFLWPLLSPLVTFFTGMIAPFVAIFGVLQLISRAMAIAKINDAKKLFELAPYLAEVAAKFVRVMDILNEGFNNVASFLAPLFEWSRYMDLAAGALNFVVDALAMVIAGFQGLAFALMEFVEQTKSYVTGGGFNTGAIGDAFNAGTDEVFERVYGKLDQGKGAVSSNVTNIGKVEIKNEFKEQMEPDRIAFSLVSQLQKVAQNPQQSNGRSMRSGLVGN